MKTERSILTAFILNLVFAGFEYIGGIVTGSAAIVSDAVHDTGDALSIGISYFLEKKSKRGPDEAYTYGYARYAAVGALITTLVLLLGSVAVIYHAIQRIVTPTEIHYDGMIVFAVVGVCVNSCAAFFTGGGTSVNRRAVNLHMLEDVWGWVAVLVGALVMRFTDLVFLDPVMSVGISVFILIQAIHNLKEIMSLFLETVPRDIRASDVRDRIGSIDGILDVHHLHLWSVDGQNHCATVHVVTDRTLCDVKKEIRARMAAFGIHHITIEAETSTEPCDEKGCHMEIVRHSQHHHH